MEQLVWQAEEKLGKPLKGSPHRAEEPSETEKETQRNRLISTAASIFAAHFRRLGIPLSNKFSKESFRFLSRDVFDAEFPAAKGDFGRHGEQEGVVIVDQGTLGERFLTLLHEMTHAAAVKKPQLDATGKLLSYINGYKIGKVVPSLSGQSRMEVHFDALNEGVVEMTAMEMVVEYIEAEDFDVTFLSKEDLDRTLGGHAFGDAVAVISVIVSALAGEGGRAAERAVWKQIECGQYTGEMAWVHEVTKMFGKESLRMIDALIASPKDESEREKNKKILWHFQQKSAEKKTSSQSASAD